MVDTKQETVDHLEVLLTFEEILNYPEYPELSKEEHIAK